MITMRLEKLQKLLAYCVVFAVCTFTALVQSHASTKVALVIGNTAYENAAPLKNPSNDADDLSKRLEEFGFKVFKGLDLGHREMRRTVERFLQSLDDADLALFFYAGHALQVNGQNYLMPVDAELQSHLDLNFETIPINFILSNMEQLVKTNIVLLDACRDNPLRDNLARSMGTRSAAVGQGLASIGTGVGTLVGFATEPGNVALDGEGRNSPYTSALLKHLGQPGEGLTRNMVNVRNAVLSTTGGKQVPWEHSSLTGEIILQPKKADEPVAPAQPVKPQVKQDPTIELAYWDSIKNANTKVYFETYVKRYPEGLFKDIALLKIAELGAAELATSIAPKKDVAASSPTPQPKAETKTSEAPKTTKLSATKKDTETQAASQTAAKATKPEAPAQKVETDTGEQRGIALNLAKAAIKKEDAAENTDAVKPIATKTPEAETPKAAEEVKVAAIEVKPAEPKVEEPVADVKEVLSGKALVKALQGELNRLGCGAGRADGIWGRGSKRALKRFVDNSEVRPVSSDPSVSLLNALKGEEGRVCPLTCRRGFEVVGDKCERIKRQASADPKPAVKTKRKTVKPKSTKRTRTKTRAKRTAPRQTKRVQAKNRWCFRCPQTPNEAAGIVCVKRNIGSMSRDGRFCKAI